MRSEVLTAGGTKITSREMWFARYNSLNVCDELGPNMQLLNHVLT
jgi:hypothetical protein